MNNFKNYQETLTRLRKEVQALNLSEENCNELLNIVEEIETHFKRYDAYIDLNFKVYEKEKEILLNHFIEKDKEVNAAYLELNGFKRTPFYLSYALVRKLYKGLFRKRT